MENNKESAEPLSHYQMAMAHRKQQEIKDGKYKDKSKKRLSNIISTKIKTSFIGSISACENQLGFLWGHGKEESELTENEIAMKDIWENIRAKILDNGNSQLRAAINELNYYSIDWDRYHLDISIQEKEGNEETE
jgi:hypothetical protein